MNPINLFKFLEKQKGIPIPLKQKIIHGIPLIPKELNVKGNLDLTNTKITSLPQGLKIGGSLYLTGCKNLTSLPPDLKIGGFLDLRKTLITSLPQDLQVGGSLNIHNTNISSLPPDLQVEGNFWIEDTPLAEKSDEEIRAMLKTGQIRGIIIR